MSHDTNAEVVATLKIVQGWIIATCNEGTRNSGQTLVTVLEEAGERMGTLERERDHARKLSEEYASRVGDTLKWDAVKY